MPKKLISINDHRKKFKTDKAAADDLELDYMTYRRWLGRKVYSPDDSAWRRILEARGIDLPRRQEVRA